MHLTRDLNLVCNQAPGDVVMLTAAIRDLKRAYPQLRLYVETRYPQLWENNPNLEISTLNGALARKIVINYAQVLRTSPHTPIHFVSAMHKYLEAVLKVPVPCTAFKGDIYMSPAELAAPRPFAEPYWVIVCGGKTDFTTKWWNSMHMQKVVDHYADRIKFVQVGGVTKPGVKNDHVHFKVDGVVDMVGRTDFRELIKLIYHADGVLCPVTMAMHLAAAVPLRAGTKRLRPCVVVAGGREPPHWEAYPGHRFLHTIGQLDCCAAGACWARRAQKWHDSTPWNTRQLCKQPVNTDTRSGMAIARCMDMITPEMVIAAIDSYYAGDFPLKVLSRTETHRSEPTPCTSVDVPSL